MPLFSAIVEEEPNILDVVILINIVLGNVEPTLAQEFSGDLNSDGSFNVLDIVLLVNFAIFIQEPTDSEFWASDLNGDNTINVLDIVILVNLILVD